MRHSVLDLVFALVIYFRNYAFLNIKYFNYVFNEGMKFARLEINLTLAKVLKNFNVNSTPSTPKSLQFVEGFALRRPMNGIPVRLTKREN